MINCIVAVDRNWGIGKKNGLLFNIKADMKYFRENTKNKIVLMGENTLLSFPGSKPLKNRVNVVLCPDGYVAGIGKNTTRKPDDVELTYTNALNDPLF